MKQMIRHYTWMLVRHVLDEMESTSGLPYQAFAARQTGIRQHIAQLKQELAKVSPDHPALHGFKVYSQADEDGIIEYLLGRLPEGNKTRTFIEVGCGNGLENNSHYLLLKGYRGVWVDGSAKNIAEINSKLSTSNNKKLLLTQNFVDLDNIEKLTLDWLAFLGTIDVDFLSIDIDGNDAYIAQAMLKHARPRLLCIEYNAKFPPSLSIGTPYDKQRVWTGNDYQGASLRFMCDALNGYTLVTCNLAGTNAFFIRNEFAQYFPQHPIETLYQPFRSELCLLQSGHSASLRWLGDVLQAD